MLPASKMNAVRGAATAAVTAVGAREAGVAAGRRMRAWRVHAYGGEPTLDAARVPALRDPRHLLVRVHTASVNPIDVAMIGGYGRTVLNVLRSLDGAGGGDGGGGGGGLELPLVVGRDFAGEVVTAGAGAARRAGERVWGVLPPHWPGAHAQYVLANDAWTGPCPEALGAGAGGVLYAALTATSALRAAGVAARGGAGGSATPPPGTRVLLLGLGGVGQFALQLMAHDGIEVVVGCAGEQCGAAERLGAACALDRHAPDYGDRLVQCGPYEAIIDCAGVGGGEAGARAWRYKRYVTLTTPVLREADARGLPAGLAASALALAAHCWRAATAPAAPAAHTAPACPPPHVRWAYFVPNREDIHMLYRRAQSGQLAVCVERVFGWREGGAALARAAGGHARGKLLLDFTEP